MRLRSLSATALAAAAVLQGRAFAAPNQAPAIGAADVKVADVDQDATDASTSSATTTYTITQTVMRVVQTTTATRDTSMVPTTLASASLTLTPYANGTMSVLGTGATPSTTSTIPPMPSAGAASYLGIDVAGVAAVAGMVGVLVA